MGGRSRIDATRQEHRDHNGGKQQDGQRAHDEGVMRNAVGQKQYPTSVT